MVRMSGFKIKDYVLTGWYDIKNTSVESKMTSEQMWIGETPGALKSRAIMDKVGSVRCLTTCHIKNVFLHL